MLEVSHLSKNYGPFRAVQDVSFTAQAGEVLGFLGPNGAGKTTTMRLITGCLPPSAGEVRVEGLPVRERPLEAKRKTGYLPELPPVYPELTVDEYLTFVARLKQVPGARRKEAVERACKKAALADVRHRVIGHLSKGYRQRVGIAQAILHDPPLLILDEPTAGLDPLQIAETRQLIRELAGQHTIVLSTHILSEVESTCERVVIIHRGRLVAVDTLANLNRSLKRTDRLAVGARGPVALITAGLRSVPGVLKAELTAQDDAHGAWHVETRSTEVRELIARRVIESGWGLTELRPLELSLEQIFLSLTAVPAEPAHPAAPDITPPAAPSPAGQA